MLAKLCRRSPPAEPPHTTTTTAPTTTTATTAAVLPHLAPPPPCRPRRPSANVSPPPNQRASPNPRQVELTDFDQLPDIDREKPGSDSRAQQPVTPPASFKTGSDNTNDDVKDGALARQDEEPLLDPVQGPFLDEPFEPIENVPIKPGAYPVCTRKIRF